MSQAPLVNSAVDLAAPKQFHQIATEKMSEMSHALLAAVPEINSVAIVVAYDIEDKTIPTGVLIARNNKLEADKFSKLIENLFQFIQRMFTKRSDMLARSIVEKAAAQKKPT